MWRRGKKRIVVIRTLARRLQLRERLIGSTDEPTWLALLADRPAWIPPPKPTIVISPHPDDETLGAGGLIAFQARRGVPVTVVAVTDGEAAYADAPGLGRIREVEQRAALQELSVDDDHIVRLRIPDSAVTKHEDALLSGLLNYVPTDSLIVAPWPFDPHPDHEACGRAVSKLSEITGAMVAFYLFWTWHWSTASVLDSVPVYRFDLDPTLQQRRAAALARHQSQLHWAGGAPILPEPLLAPARRSFETFIIYG